MKAAFFKEHGGAEKILYVDYRDPCPRPARWWCASRPAPSTRSERSHKSVAIFTRVYRGRVAGLGT